MPLEGAEFRPLRTQTFDPEIYKGGVKTGLKRLDDILGPLPKGMFYILGGYTHSGKTQLALTMILNNPDKRFILFTPDELTPFVLQKLWAAALDIHIDEARELPISEQERVIEEHFPLLQICDRSLTPGQMRDYMAACEQHWQADTDMMFYDYVECLPVGQGDGTVKQKVARLKELSEASNVPMLAIHQSSRGGSKDSDGMSMSNLAYGGEQEAIAVIICRRCGGDSSVPPEERHRDEHYPTVNVAVVKNKLRSELTKGQWGIPYAISKGGKLRPHRLEERLPSEVKRSQLDPLQEMAAKYNGGNTSPMSQPEMTTTLRSVQ